MSAEQPSQPRKEVLSYVPEDVQTIDWTEVGQIEDNETEEFLAHKAVVNTRESIEYEDAIKEPESVKIQTEENLKQVLARLEENKIKWGSTEINPKEPDLVLKETVPATPEKTTLGSETVETPKEAVGLEIVESKEHHEAHEHPKDSATEKVKEPEITVHAKEVESHKEKPHVAGGHGHDEKKTKPWGLKDWGTTAGAVLGGFGVGAALTLWGAPALTSFIGIQTTIVSSLATVGLTGFIWAGLGATAVLGFLFMIGKAIYDERGKFPGMSFLGGGGGSHTSAPKKAAAAPAAHGH